MLPAGFTVYSCGEQEVCVWGAPSISGSSCHCLQPPSLWTPCDQVRGRGTSEGKRERVLGVRGLVRGTRKARGARRSNIGLDLRSFPEGEPYGRFQQRRRTSKGWGEKAAPSRAGGRDSGAGGPRGREKRQDETLGGS